MFVARARSRAHRRYFEVGSLGLAYSKEELEDLAEDNGRLPGVELERSVSPWQQPQSPAVPAPAGGTPAFPAPQPSPQAAVIPPAAPAVGIDYTPPLSTPDQQSEAKLLISVLCLSQADWSALMAQHGVTSFKELRRDSAASLLAYLDKLRQISILRKSAGVTDEQWAKALAKRQVIRAIELKPTDALEIYNKLYESVTPFERQRLGIDPKPEDALGNVPPPPSPSAVAA
jgi:hypothetical protein